MRALYSRTAILVAVSVLLMSGCSTTQTMARHFVNTQPMVKFKAKDYEAPEKIVGGTAEAYIPHATGNDPDLALLNRYAPIIVQGTEAPEKQSYAQDSDRIGTPTLHEVSHTTYNVTIDPQTPRIYCSAEKVQVRGVTLTQLVYVFWYPRHPVGVVEKGDIDGGVLRITLDAEHHPAIYEYVMACGCWHGVFVSDNVEAWAQSEFSSKIPGKQHFVETNVDSEDDWKVRDIVLNQNKFARPVLFISAGRHECVAIQPESIVRNLSSLKERQYEVAGYSELEHLPLNGSGDAKASMFNEEGLVWGAQRKGEEKVFTKLDHGGWPRRLDAMKIHWDEESWNDAHLLDKFLRLPARLRQSTHS